jgi:CysZ protein
MDGTMVSAFALALGDAFAAEQRRPLLLSLGLSLVLLAGLWAGATALLAGAHVSGVAWLDTAIELLGSLAALFIAWTLYPAVTMLVLGFFFDRVAAAIERAHYPELPPPRRVGFGEVIGSGLRLALLAVVLNLVLLPLYLFPGINLFVYYGLNGYLIGRGYFEAVALRRLEWRQVRAMWRWCRFRLIFAGAVVAFLLSLPLINLVAPLIGVAFMLHLFEALRRRTPAPGA